MSDEPRSIDALIDPRRSTFITAVGKKGSGKSHLAARFWATWPFDRIAIDPTGDARVHHDDERHPIRKLETPLPLRWPSELGDERVSLHFVPDVGAATYRDDLDRAVGLAMTNRRTLAWIDEVGELTRANSTPPHMRRALHQGRHRDLSLLMCCPRPVDIDPLVLAQADYVYVFDLPNPNDRRRVADVIGVAPAELDDAVHALGKYEFLRYSADDDELAHFPKLPPLRAPRTPRGDFATSPAERVDATAS